MTHVQRSLLCIVAITAMSSPQLSAGHESAEAPAVVPQAERELAKSNKLDGPTQNQGIKSVTQKGSVALGTDFPALADRQLRAREIVIEPGGVVAVHQHDQRPGVAYIIEGEIFEHRNDSPTPQLRRAGDTAFEQTGVAHWWENKSTLPVRALVVDIVSTDTK